MREYVRRAYRVLLPILYAHRQFKLFLNAGPAAIGARTQALASVTDFFSGFVRSIPIRAPFGDSVLVVAPHQDDEIIGCGGALALQVRSGKKALTVVVQDGGDGHEDLGMSRETMRDLRNEESRRAAASLQMEPPRFLNHAVLTDRVAQASAELLEIIKERKVDAIFTPFLLDGNSDHRTTNRILSAALKDVPWNIRVLGYEVWGLAVPNVLVIIDQVMDEKLKALSCFAFANKALDYVHSTKGLNMYRSRLLGAGECKYAECYFELPREQFIELADRIYQAER